MLDEGVWADVEIAGEHLRLFSEHNAQGVQCSVYSVNRKQWITPSEPVQDIEEGKERATEHARAYLNKTGTSQLSLSHWQLNWKKARSL